MELHINDNVYELVQVSAPAYRYFETKLPDIDGIEVYGGWEYKSLVINGKFYGFWRILT